MKKDLGLLDSTLLVMGSMVGSGIFIVSSEISRIVGSPGLLLLTWLGIGLLVLAIALTYGELAAMMPRVGGQYIFLKEAYSPLVGFVFGWTYFLVIATGSIAAVQMAFAKFAASLFPALGEHHILLQIGAWKLSATQVVAMVCIALLAAINCRGVHHGKIIQNVLTIIKVFTLLGLIVAGLFIGYNHDIVLSNLSHFWDSSWTHVADGKISHMEVLTGFGCLVALATAAVGAFFSLDSWNIIAGIAGEVKNPKKTIPMSLILGVGAVVTLYVLANVAYLCVLPLNGNPGAADAVGRGIQFADGARVGEAAVTQIFGVAGGLVMSFLIMLSCLGCGNGMTLGAARVYYAMAKDGLFFDKLGALNAKGVPSFALIAQGAWACLLCLSGSYDQLLDYAVLAIITFYLLSLGAVFLLRWRRPEAERPYKALGYPILPALCMLLVGAILVNLLIYKPENTWPSLILVLLGVPAYYLKIRSTAKKSRQVIVADQVSAG